MKLIKKCRLCRAEGKKLYLKGDRCELAKCSFTRRSYRPGKSEKTFLQQSDFAKQLRAKQTAKRIYGLSEKQLLNNYTKASKIRGATGENLLQFLECRLDNVVYRLGFAISRISARQLIGHGHILLNNKKNNIASTIVKADDKIRITDKIKTKIVNKQKNETLPVWLKLEKDKLSGEVIKIPARNEMILDIDDQLIVEFYSR